MERLIANLLKGLLALIVLGFALVYFFRLPLIEAVIESQLARLGIEGCSFSVRAVSMNHLVLRDVTLDGDQGLSADEIATNWTLDALLNGTVSSVSIEGLRWSLDLRDGASPALSPSQTPGSGKNTGVKIPVLPNITLSDATLLLHSVAGETTVSLNGALERAAPDLTDLVLNLKASAMPRISPNTSPMGSAPASLESAIQASLTARIGDYRTTPAYTLDLNVSGALNNPQATTEADLQMASVMLNAEGVFAPLELINENWMTWLALATLEGQSEVRLERVAIPGKVGDLSGDLGLSLRYAEGRGGVTVAESSQLTGSGFNQQWLEQLGVPPADQTIRLFTTGENSTSFIMAKDRKGAAVTAHAHLALESQDARVNLGFNSKTNLAPDYSVTDFVVDDLVLDGSNLNVVEQTLDRFSLKGGLRGTPQHFSGTIDAEVAAKRFQLGGIDARQIALTLPAHVRFEPNGLEIFLEQAGKIRAANLKFASNTRSSGPLTVNVPAGSLALASESTGWSLQHRIELHPERFTLLVSRDNDSSLKAVMGAFSAVNEGKRPAGQPYRGTTQVRDASIALPQYDIELGRVAVSYSMLAEKGMDVRFNMADVRHLADVPLFSPMTLTGNATLIDDRIRVTAKAGPANASAIQLKGKHSLKSGKGSLNIVGDDITFVASGLQPSHYVPDLGALKDVSGAADVNSQLSWSTKGLDSHGQLDLSHWSFKIGETQVSDLSARLELMDLITPRSAQNQEISVGEIDVGIPLKDFSARYEVQAGRTPQLAINQARVRALGGMLSLEPTVLDPFAKGLDAIVVVDDLDLATLFELIEVEGLTGEGALDGRIPISFRGDEVSISNGNLAARAPGILRVNSKAVSDVLGGRVENVDLLIEALTEFHYSELTLALNNSGNNDMVVGLSMLGNNPRVLDGRMFRLNINLESNISKLLNALAQAYGLSNEALARALRLH